MQDDAGARQEPEPDIENQNQGVPNVAAGDNSMNDENAVDYSGQG